MQFFQNISLVQFISQWKVWQLLLNNPVINLSPLPLKKQTLRVNLLYILYMVFELYVIHTKYDNSCRTLEVNKT